MKREIEINVQDCYELTKYGVRVFLAPMLSSFIIYPYCNFPFFNQSISSATILFQIVAVNFHAISKAKILNPAETTMNFILQFK